MKINFKKITEIFKGTPRVLAENLFLAIMVLILFALVIGGAVFYKYGFSLKDIVPQSGQTSIRFNENAYQAILGQWDGAAERFGAASSKVYPNPF